MVESPTKAAADALIDRLQSDVSFAGELDKDDLDELITLMANIYAEAYEEGYNEGMQAPPPEPSHHYE